MLSHDLLAFVRASLPTPPCRVLEVGAGRGELAAALSDAGYDVTAIDPAAEPESRVEPLPLLEAAGSFDAALAVVSLHHVDPLEESCAHLAALIVPGGRLVIDELDIGRYDARAMEWWMAQRRAVGADDAHGRDAAELLGHLVAHLHPLERICAALRPWFEVGEPVRGPYLHRWELRPSLRDAEVELIAEGRLPATGARIVAVRPS